MNGVAQEVQAVCSIVNIHEVPNAWGVTYQIGTIQDHEWPEMNGLDVVLVFGDWMLTNKIDENRSRFVKRCTEINRIGINPMQFNQFFK
jgi:hypothetical protein